MRIRALLVSFSIGMLAPLAASASVLTLSGGELEFQVGGFIPLSGPATSTPEIFVSSGPGNFGLPPSVFQVDLGLPTQLFTGVTLISTLNIDATNLTASFVAGGGPGGGFGGAGPLSGQAVIGVLGGLLNIDIPLSVVGAGGFQTAEAGLLMISATGHLWTTGPAMIAGLTSATPSGGFTNTITVSGFDNRTAGHKGSLLLVSPLRVISGAFGVLPSFVTMSLTFVPEPGVVVLIGSALLALVGVSRKRY